MASLRSLVGLTAPMGVVVLLALPAALPAASTGTVQLPTVQGSGAATSQGDYVTSEDALDDFYYLWIEVPPGLGRLTVELFDPDVGRGGGGEANANRDRARGSWNTDVDYRLFDPGGTQRAQLNNCDDDTCNDNVWQTLFNGTTSLTAGHWRLEVRQDSDETDGDDINAFGVRAHDGSSGAGGTELPVYWDTFATYGTNNAGGATASRTYQHYPWITSGCRLEHDDFDFDDAGGMTYTSRDLAFVGTEPTPSGNDEWSSALLGPWTSDQSSTGYGVWDLDVTIDGYPGNANYGQVYLGNDQAADPPPSGQLLPNVFRIYLPTDAGAAPAKPYAEQLLTWKEGPNPPDTGVTSTFVVTVRVVNPTTRPIVFSTPNNTVLSNVPGSGVVYAGNAQVSQGSLVGQPAIGGTGNVVWNPGTLAAGGTGLLAYRVSVTPTANGQRLPVTATPASVDGTRAQYVDETGNTTQTRATYRLGPLCELAVTEGLLTHALVARFAAVDEGGRQVVEWETAGEAGTLGFELWRADRRGAWERAHEGLLAAPEPTPQGAVWRFVDEGVSPRHAAIYLLVEVDRAGERRTFGPFAVDASAPAVRRPRARLAAPVHLEPTLEVRPRAGQPAPVVKAAAAPAAKARLGTRLLLGVRHDGLYFLSQAELAERFGLPLRRARTFLALRRFALAEGGRPVPIMVPDDLSGLYFHGRGIDSLFTRERPYELTLAYGEEMATTSVGAGSGAGGDAFVATARAEEDRFAATVLPLDARSDYWFWEGLLGDHPTVGTKRFAVAAPGAVPGAAATLDVRLQGASAGAPAVDHRVRVRFAGVEIGQLEGDGIAPMTASFDVPPGLLAAVNEVELVAERPAGVALSALYVDGFDLAYPRDFRAQGGELVLRGDGHPTVEVTGLGSGDVLVFDLADPTAPRRAVGFTTSTGAHGTSVRFAPATADTPYLVVERAAARAPAWVRSAGSPRDLRRWKPVDLVLLAPESLLAEAERLAELRRAEGLRVAVVDVGDVFDQFAHGVPDPAALRDFLATLRRRDGGRPMALLVGDGTLDYRDLLGQGGNLVPTWMTTTPSGLFAADALLGDVAGGDGVPDMVVGRLPVRDAAGLAAVVDRLAAQRAAPAGGVVLLADDAEGAARFAAGSEAVAAQLPDQAPLLLDLDTSPVADLRAALFAALDDGAAAVSYLGHGGADRLGAPAILTTGDVPALAGAPPFLLTALTCTVARFELPGFTTLAEALVLGPAGGATAVWAPTGLVDYRSAEVLATHFYRALRTATAPRLGELVTAATASYLAAGGDPAVLATAALLGDPTQPVRLTAPAPPAPGGDPVE